MSATYSEFLRGLYAEHLEEASFLYEQRRRLLTDAELPWPAMADFEERLEAHVDALVVGGELAADACRLHAAGGDAGELFAAVSAFCRQQQAPLLAGVLKTLDYADPDRTTALTDALKYGLPDEWEEFCVRALATGNPELVAILATTLGYRRLQVADALLQALRAASGATAAALLWSVGRTGGQAALPTVRSFVRSDHAAVAAAAAHAALRLHDREALAALVSSPGADIDPIGLGLSGGRRTTTLLLAGLRQSRRLETITALGLVGDLAAVRPLLELLGEETVAGAAADALHVITGAPLFEEVIVPDDMSEEEMLPDEVDAYRERGALPRRADGQPYGTKVRRLTRDPARWTEWLTANASRFVADQRYRLGMPCTPAVLVECLRSSSFPKPYRQWIGDELVMRYGVDLTFEPDLPVRRQRELLARADAARGTAADSFAPGGWYFAGQPV